MPIKTTKLKDILTKEQVYPETNVGSIVDFDNNISVNDQTTSGDTYLTSLTFKGTRYKVAGDVSADLDELQQAVTDITNGEELNSFADVEGELDNKQATIDSNHKLNADLIGENLNKKFVTEAEKEQITTNKNDISSLRTLINNVDNKTQASANTIDVITAELGLNNDEEEYPSENVPTIVEQINRNTDLIDIVVSELDLDVDENEQFPTENTATVGQKLQTMEDSINLIFTDLGIQDLTDPTTTFPTESIKTTNERISQLETKLPEPPSADGTYHLEVTVNNGTITYN